MATSPALQKYLQMHRAYATALECCAGCVRAQSSVDNHFKDLQDAYAALSPEERKEYYTPRRVILRDDDTGGFASGLATFGANLNRIGYY